MSNMDTLQPFKKGDKRASDAGKKSKRGKSMKTIIQDIINEKLPEDMFKDVRNKFNLPKEVSQGEMAARLCMIALMKSGDAKSLKAMMELSGEFDASTNVNNFILLNHSSVDEKM